MVQRLTVALSVLVLLSSRLAHAYTLVRPCTSRSARNAQFARAQARQHSLSGLFLSKNDNEEEEDDFDKIFQEKDANPMLDWEFPQKANKEAGKLGIDVGSLLAPLTEQEAADLKAAATEVINDAIASGIDEIETVRARMKLELQEQRRQMQQQSERNMEQASASLLGRIDALTDAFLANTTLSRTSTKLAASADRAMEGRGVDMGTWGTLGGATVVTGTVGLGSGGSTGGVGLASTQDLASSTSVDASSSGGASETRPSRLLVVADTKDDAYAKQLIEPLSQELEQVLPDLEVQTMKPTETWPLGGNDAVAVLLFLTSLSDASTVKNGLERLLRQTMTAGGKLAQPPSQIVAISSVGTSRTNQMPYSMKNMLSGGQLEKRKQMEEAVQLMVEQSAGKKRPPFLDYTICKLGEIKSNGNKEAFSLSPGDGLDGTLDVDSAVAVLKQAIALQPAARNATFCAVGGSVKDVTQEEWDDLFLQLDGPELLRVDLTATGGEFGQLVEYMQEWSDLPATSKGLTTPIRVDQATAPVLPMGVRQQHAIQLLYLPTATGTRYMSRDEEKEREQERSSNTASSSTATTSRRPTKEGGLEILLEITETPKPGMRVRVKRCNYAPGVVIKELTEQTLLSRIKKTIEVWRKQHT